MLNKIKVLLFGRKYLEWDEYKGKIDCISLNDFQQDTRKESVRNLPFF
ncbi:MAG: hypothetical protein ABIG69_11830 [Bacteroidota bacterium]